MSKHCKVRVWDNGDMADCGEQVVLGGSLCAEHSKLAFRRLRQEQRECLVRLVELFGGGHEPFEPDLEEFVRTQWGALSGSLFAGSSCLLTLDDLRQLVEWVASRANAHYLEKKEASE